MNKNTALTLCASLVLFSCGPTPAAPKVSNVNTQPDPVGVPPETKPDPAKAAAEVLKNSSQNKNVPIPQPNKELSCASAEMLARPSILGTDNYRIDSIAGKDTLNATLLRSGAAAQKVEIERSPESKADSTAPLSWRGVFILPLPEQPVSFAVTLNTEAKKIQLSTAKLTNIAIECQKYPDAPTAADSAPSTSTNTSNTGVIGTAISGASISNVIYDNSNRASNVTTINISPNSAGSAGTGTTTTTLSPNITTSQSTNSPNPNNVNTTTTINGVTTTTTTTNTSSNSFQTSGN